MLHVDKREITINTRLQILRQNWVKASTNKTRDQDILEKTNYEYSRKISGCQGYWERGGGMNRWNTEHFGGDKIIKYDIIMVNTICYALVKTHRMHTKSETSM